MASLSAGGVPLPLDEVRDERVIDPANAGIAVQNHGYWASGYLSVARQQVTAQVRAKEALAAALASARNDSRLPDGVAANAIGLSLDSGSTSALEAGAVYAVTASAKENGQTAYASALVAVTDKGRDVLWQSN
jgi:ABC-type phosphate/phosphonate transport system substrate-binding protein